MRPGNHEKNRETTKPRLRDSVCISGLSRRSDGQPSGKRGVGRATNINLRRLSQGPVAMLVLPARAAGAGRVALDLAPGLRIVGIDRPARCRATGACCSTSSSPVSGSMCDGLHGGQGRSAPAAAAAPVWICTCISWRTTSAAQLGEQGLEQLEGLALVFVQRIALAVAAQADILAQMVEIDDVLAPVVVERLQQDRLLDIAHDFGAEIRRRARRRAFSTAFRMRSRTSSSAMPSSLVQSTTGRSTPKMLLHLVVQARRRPTARHRPFPGMWRATRSSTTSSRKSAIWSETSSDDMISRALLEDHLALVVEHVVVFQDVLADLEVARFDLLLRLFQRLVHPGMGDRFARLQAEPREDRIHALRAEDAHQIVLQRQEEFRGAGIALAARAAAQLVVDAPAFVPLGADDVETAGGQRLLLVGGDFGADLARSRAGALVLVGDAGQFVP